MSELGQQLALMHLAEPAVSRAAAFAGREAGVEAGQGLVPVAIVATREGSQGMRRWQPGCVRGCAPTPW